MTEPDDQAPGQPFAFAFYSVALQKTQPAAVRAFSKLRYSAVAAGHLSTSRTVNILWRGAHINLVMPQVEALYPDVAYRGVFTDQNILLPLPAGTEPLKIIGSPIKLEDFTDGPIQRREAPSEPKRRGLRLIALDGQRLD